jgi:hypothetical protein
MNTLRPISTLATKEKMRAFLFWIAPVCGA